MTSRDWAATAGTLGVRDHARARNLAVVGFVGVPMNPCIQVEVGPQGVADEGDLVVAFCVSVVRSRQPAAFVVQSAFGSAGLAGTRRRGLSELDGFLDGDTSRLGEIIATVPAQSQRAKFLFDPVNTDRCERR